MGLAEPAPPMYSVGVNFVTAKNASLLLLGLTA